MRFPPLRLTILGFTLAAFSASMTTVVHATLTSAPTVADFVARARRGEPLSVLFLGGSLTFGAGSSDPQTTSYRGRMMHWLHETYPRTPLTFHDAAIGGTGSTLALFRLDRDVLPHRPDLVFLDFTVNDDLYSANARSLATYERVLRELREHGAAVVPVLMCTRKEIEAAELEEPLRYRLHRDLAQHYGLVPADTLGTTRRLITQRALAVDQLYLAPDRTHPDDAGYGLFFEAARDAFTEAAGHPTSAPIPANFAQGDLYPKRQRLLLSTTPLPPGWTRVPAYRTAMWFDGLSSRWLGDVACARTGAAPLEVDFQGTFVALFGERNAITPRFRVWIDGRPAAQRGSKAEDPQLWDIRTTVHASPGTGAGNLFAWTFLAEDLAEGKHHLTIEPVFTDAAPGAELRIESVCSAGRE